MSHSLTRTYIHTQRKDAKSAKDTLRKYSYRDCKVHWESSDGWPAAEDVWSTVAWRRGALTAAHATNCRQRASTLTTDADTTMIHIRVWPDLFVIYFTGCVNNSYGLIFISDDCGWAERTFSFCWLWSVASFGTLCSFSMSSAGAIIKVEIQKRCCVYRVVKYFYFFITL